MFSVYRKELKLYFKTLSTYIVLAILLSAVGICTALFATIDGLQFVPVYLAPLTLLLAPMVQIFANRRQRKTNFEPCCFAMGISPISLTVGRFLATLTVFLIPALELALMPALLSTMGNVSYGKAYVSVLGYALLVALTLSATQVLLDVIPNKRTSAICAFVPPVAFYVFQFLITLLPLGDTVLSILTAINPIGLFYAFTHGRFPIAACISLMAGTAFCLALGALFGYGRRGDFSSANRRRSATAIVAIALVLTIALGTGAFLIPERIMNPKTDDSQTFEIVAGAKDYLKTLREDITIYYLVLGGKKAADTDMLYFLYDFAACSLHVQVEIVDSLNATELKTRYGITQTSTASLIITSHDRYLLLSEADFYHYYNSQLQLSLTPSQYYGYLEAYSNYSTGQYDETSAAYGQQLYTYAQYTTAYFDGCVRLINAIHYVTSDTVSVAKVYDPLNAMDANLRTYLISAGYYFETVTSPLQIGSDCDLLILHAPKNDLTTEEANALSNYLTNGGNVFLITSCLYSDLPNLYSVTQKFGLNAMEAKNVVCEQDAQYQFSADHPYYFAAHIADCEITKDFNGFFTVINAHAIQISDSLPDGVSAFPLLYTGAESGYLMYSNSETDMDNKGQIVCGAVAQKDNATLFWLSSPESAGKNGYLLSNGGNFTVIHSAINRMTQHAYTNINIASTQITTGNLTITQNGVTVLAVILALAIPLAVIIPASVSIYKRKKR